YARDMRADTWIVRRGSQLALVAVLLFVAHAVSAQITIRDPNPPRYSVEIEPKLNAAYLFSTGYGGNAWGPGVRFSIPVMSPGFVKTINDSIAISFGADLLHYNGRAYYCNGRGCPATYYSDSFWALYVPVTMQWNFWLTDKWSV